jgi:hypothetical protein
MWDSSYMADFDNLSEINENFDTIKTLLNSIRAQGVLNTSDVDKLLTGINSKLEKINTEEDIDVIKIFLSELKQNLEERHNVLISKFGAIESLFANLLKNSAELPKSTELKELFDIVATNLSVFSREVVSQKDTLTDITLRLDAIRSDDSQKKDIIKNITLLKPDLERLNNGFDSIVLSLNDNFKTIIKTITTLDKTDYLERFSDVLSGIEMSSNTVLSAIQVLDKKAETVNTALDKLANKDDLNFANQKLVEIAAQGQEIVGVVTDFSSRYYRIDNLADKIDASVSIIAGIKPAIEESNDKNAKAVLNSLEQLEQQVINITTDSKFEEFKATLGGILKEISENTNLLNQNISISLEEVKKLDNTLNALDINVNFQSVFSELEKTKQEINYHIDESAQRINTLNEANVSRVLNDVNSNADNLNSRLSKAQAEISSDIAGVLNSISTSAESLGEKLNQTQSELSVLCEKNFNSVYTNIADLKTLVSQIDENSISANNAIFASITDRLTMFENSLKDSLETQEKTVFESSAKLVEQVENIKNISSVLDYKMDSSVVEVGNIKREFGDLKSAVEDVLALDFVTTVKDLRVDLYASKQELENALETTENELSEKLTNDLYGKYELLISKLDAVGDEFKKTQTSSLLGIKSSLENISSSIIDVLSYVSERKSVDSTEGNANLTEFSDILKEHSLNYVENVRDIVDIIRIQIENSLKNIENESVSNTNEVKKAIVESSEDIKNDIKCSYSKLLEIQDSYKELKDILNVTSLSSTDKIENLISSADGIKSDFEGKMVAFKNALLDKITEFKQEFTCDNADKVNELKFAVENTYSKNSGEIENILSELRKLINKLSEDSVSARTATLAKILDNFVGLKDLMISMSDKQTENLAQKVDVILEDFAKVKNILEKVDENVDGDMTRQLSIIESNFESLVSQITILFDKSDKTLTDKINAEFVQISDKMQDAVAEKLEDYKSKIEEAFDSLSTKADEQSEYIKDRVAELNTTMKSVLDEQAEDNLNQIEEVTEKLRAVLEENAKLSAVDYVSLKGKLKEFAQNIETNNQSLTQEMKSQLDDITRYIDSVIDLQAQDILAKHEEVKSATQTLTEKCEDICSKLASTSDDIATTFDNKYSVIENKLASLEENAIGRIDSSSSNTLKTIAEISLASTAQLDKMNDSLLESMTDAKKATHADIATLTNIIEANKTVLEGIEGSINEKSELIKTQIADVTSNGLHSLETYVTNILEQIELEKQNVNMCKDLIVEFSKNEFNILSKNIEKETDVIVGELVEQFELLRKSQDEEVINLTSTLEGIINSQVYTNIEDLKAYLDVKTDNSILSEKLDVLKTEITTSVDDITVNLNKMLDTGVFTSAMSDYRLANEIFINSSIDKLNDKIEEFINENISTIGDVLSTNNKNIEDKLALFDKKFVETLVDKYEEIKLLSNQYNNSMNDVRLSLSKIIDKFEGTKDDLCARFDNLIEAIQNSSQATNNEIKQLSASFEDLRAQISNKSFDEAFQASINKQIGSLEALISQQFDYISDINELCANNLPDVGELNTFIKHSILASIEEFKELLEKQNIKDTIEEDLKQFKSDVITQFLNLFNQISFVAEQEEILDFINEKHDELITILSHIVTTSGEITSVKNTVSDVDNKISSLKNDIETINEKITSIISSDGDIDYIYSLQDLESDIANLRLVLNGMSQNDHSAEFETLISSTNDVYKLVEAIKSELPTKNDIEGIAEDIVSISSRTNKLILASDDSYKTLQDNLQDFKLVINDLDERTRNFAQESGMDRIDAKLNAINTMMQSGSKTNQVFNQVFEYLAEWVDNASIQINTISDKIETLDEIGQIKVMLEDLKADTENNNESVELIEALGSVFDKQTKRISSLESKLDKIIVETTINNKNNKIDMSPMENTLNRFLVAIDEKLTSQQDKISELEAKLADILDGKETAQLTKKVGGMDRQIAKLNKSIEKIASHVVEK